MRTLFAQLSWSHFQRGIKVQDEKARTYYLTEAAQNMWSVRNYMKILSYLLVNMLIIYLQRKNWSEK